MMLFFVFGTVLSFPILIVAQAVCYGQSGNVNTAANNSICDTGSLPSRCCPTAAGCLSNGLCEESGTLFMGTCSDSKWTGKGCIEYCGPGSMYMATCSPASAGVFCCSTGIKGSDGQDECCSGDATYTLGAMASASTLGFTTVSSSPAATTTVRSAVTTTSSLEASITASTSSIPTASAANNGSSSVWSGPSTGVKVGASFGSVAGVAIIGLIVWLCTFLKRRKRITPVVEEPGPGIIEVKGLHELPIESPRSHDPGYGRRHDTFEVESSISEMDTLKSVTPDRDILHYRWPMDSSVHEMGDSERNRRPELSPDWTYSWTPASTCAQSPKGGY